MKTSHLVLSVGTTLVLLSAAACGGGAGGGTPNHYVMSGLFLQPSGSAQFARDLDGVDGIDDQLNQLFDLAGPMAGLGGLQEPINAAIKSGDLIILNSVRADNLSNDNAAEWQIYEGNDVANPQFMGNDTFTVRADTPLDDIVTGAISSGTFSGGPAVDIRFNFVFGGAPLRLDLYATYIEGTVTADECGSDAAPVTLAGGIAKTQFDTTIIPLVAAGINSSIQKECPGTAPNCNCPLGSSLGLLLRRADTDPDCRLSNQELLNSDLAPFFRPDCDLFNGDQFGPGIDRTKDSLGVGVGFVCTRANFTAPNE